MVTDLKRISTIEKLASRAWPAKFQLVDGGWLLRASEGITRRANSVLPRGDVPDGNIKAAIQRVREFYELFELPMRFQLTEASKPSNLDETLKGLGLTIDMKVNVQTALIRGFSQDKLAFAVKIDSDPFDAWFQGYARCAGYDAKSIRVRKGIITHIEKAKAFATVSLEGEIVGVGLGVVESGWLGLFAVATAERVRRQGIATAISKSLIQWGQSIGAKNAYLQVAHNNPEGIELYHKLGFQDSYQYWYRVEE